MIDDSGFAFLLGILIVFVLISSFKLIEIVGCVIDLLLIRAANKKEKERLIQRALNAKKYE